MEGICEMGPTLYCSYPRRLASLTICWFNCIGNTFYSVILRPWVLVRLESNSRPPAWQPDVPPTEPPVAVVIKLSYRKCRFLYFKVKYNSIHFWSREAWRVSNPTQWDPCVVSSRDLLHVTKISVKFTSWRQHCNKLFEGMEAPQLLLIIFGLLFLK